MFATFRANARRSCLTTIADRNQTRNRLRRQSEAVRSPFHLSKMLVKASAFAGSGNSLEQGRFLLQGSALAEGNARPNCFGKPALCVACAMPKREDRMTEALADRSCTPCRGGIPPLTHGEAERLRVQVPDWQLLDDAHRIERSFRFRDFREALTFVQGVGELAEAQGHHPDISFGWGHATVSLRTKKIKGLHENDFIMATKIDRLFGREGQS
jgi:4a-hydroxytetrahydrobiopterin dehydratase